MSATRDSSQKPVFVFSNLHELFKKAQEASKEGPFSTYTPTQSQIIKAAQARANAPVKPLDTKGAQAEAAKPGTAQPHKPVHFLPAREQREVTRPILVPRPASLPPAPTRNDESAKDPVPPMPADLAQSVRRAADIAARASRSAAVDDLKKNLGELKDLHARLKFLLQELEELSDKE